MPRTYGTDSHADRDVSTTNFKDLSADEGDRRHFLSAQRPATAPSSFDDSEDQNRDVDRRQANDG